MYIEKSCCFLGHSNIYENGIRERLSIEVEKVIDNGISFFYVGGMVILTTSAALLSGNKKRYTRIFGCIL